MKMLLVTLFLVGATFAACTWAVFRFAGLSTAGDFGDAFTAVGAGFSALAFAGLIVAIVLQRQELALQRQELAMTREELAGQKAQLEAQNRTMSREVFESCFFQLVRLNRECVASFTALFPEAQQHLSGLHAFRQAAAHLVADMRVEFNPPLTVEQKSELMAMDFTRFCLAPPSDFSHYFRNLYHVFSFIDRSDLPNENKIRYASIVRAQMSNAELILLFANAQTPAGRPFREFIQRYALFKVLMWPGAMKTYADLFSPEAYGLKAERTTTGRADNALRPTRPDAAPITDA